MCPAGSGALCVDVRRTRRPSLDPNTPNTLTARSAKFHIVGSNTRSGRGNAPRELPRGPHSLTRAQVEESQRRRIIAATIEAVGELGYTNTPVSEIIARAGVSRKAFYAHFPNREGCFLAASDVVIAATIELLERTYHAANGGADGVESAIRALFEQALANHHALRLVLIELGALGDAGSARRERLIAASEQILRDYLGIAPDSASALPDPILRATIGGLNRVLHSRATGRVSKLSKGFVRDLVRWLYSYHPYPSTLMSSSHMASPRSAVLAGGRAPGTLAPAPIATARRGLRGDARSSHSLVVHRQRERILDAVALLSAAGSFATVTVTGIGEHASVSPETFYAHFAGKEDAFLVTYEVGHEKSLAAVESACWSEPDWPSGVMAGIGALFEFLAAEPAYARLALVDAMVATQRTAARAWRGLADYEQLFTRGLEEAGESTSALTLEAVMGGLLELCLTYTLNGRTWMLPSFVRPATYFTLAPVIGADAAARVASASG